MSRTKRLAGGPWRVRLPTLHTAQRQVAAEAARWNVVCCGRRWGKTTLGIDRLVAPALRGHPVAWFAPTYRMLAEVWRALHQAVQPITVRATQSERRLELLTGGVIELWSLEQANTVRGRRYRRVVIDEAALVRDLASAWQAVVRPTLTDLRGDGWLLSTPKGRDFFWRCFERGRQADAATPWRSWHMPTSTNPHIAADELASARAELPEWVFQQEYEAQFLEADGTVFRRVLEAATGPIHAAAQEGHSYVVGVDWARAAGGDYTCFAVVERTLGALVWLERLRDMDFAHQLARLRGLAQQFRPEVIVAEQNSFGLPLVEQLQREGELPLQPFVTTARSKMRLIDGLALALEQGTLRLPRPEAGPVYGVLLDELRAFSLERLPSGLVRYSAPPGQHDDTVLALALAWEAGRDAGSLVLW